MEITGEIKDRQYDVIDGETACILDEQICKNIFEIIQTKEEGAAITELRKFFAWLDMTNRVTEQLPLKQKIIFMISANSRDFLLL